jgi:DNA-binding protein HU-beta
MNKDDLANLIMDDTGIKTKTTAEKVVDVMLDSITKGLQTDGEVVIAPLGKFKKILRNARMGRNPQTGEEIEIPERTVVRFLPSRNLKQEIKDPGDDSDE